MNEGTSAQMLIIFTFGKITAQTYFSFTDVAGLYGTQALPLYGNAAS